MSWTIIEKEREVKDIRSKNIRPKDILEGLHPYKHLSLPRRPRQPLNHKPRCLKIATYFSFRAISNEHSTFIQQIETLLHARKRP
jgi:hypothetical protein